MALSTKRPGKLDRPARKAWPCRQNALESSIDLLGKHGPVNKTALAGSIDPARKTFRALAGSIDSARTAFRALAGSIDPARTTFRALAGSIDPAERLFAPKLVRFGCQRMPQRLAYRLPASIALQRCCLHLSLMPQI